MATECPYSTKKEFPTRSAARAGAQNIRTLVEEQGRVFNTLYPYCCPTIDHWHLSSAQQGSRVCPTCDERRPAWRDKIRRQWVVYAHDDCPTQAV